MKAVICSIIIISFFTYSNSYCEDVIRPTSKEMCTRQAVTAGQYKCCYISYDVNYPNGEHVAQGVFNCISITQNDYKNVGSFVNSFRSQEEEKFRTVGENVQISNVDIKCSSSYLKFGIFLVVLFLL